MISQIIGVLWEAVPGKFGMLVPVDIEDDGTIVNADDSTEETTVPIDDDEPPSSPVPAKNANQDSILQWG